MDDLLDTLWQKTLDSLSYRSKLLDEIHEKYPGKDNRVLRDSLCKPHRDICVQLHYERINLVRKFKYVRG